MVSKSTAPTRIFLVDDHPLVISALKELMQDDSSFLVIGHAKTGAEAVLAITRSMPDIVVLDLGLPDISGEEVIRRVSSASPKVKFLVLTATRTATVLQLAISAGARGVISKTAVEDELMNALHSVAAGAIYVDPILRAAPAAEHDLAVGLSPREHSVLRLVAQGMANKQIASELNIGLKTVETHRSRALSKLGLVSRSDIFHFARSQGWLTRE